MPEEYNLPLGLDIERVIQQAARVESTLANLNRAAANVGTTTQQTFNNAATAASNLQRNVAAQTQAFGETTRSIHNMQGALESLKRQMVNESDVSKIRLLNTEIQKLEGQITRTSNIGRAGFDSLGNKIKETQTKAESFGSSLLKLAGTLGIVFSVQEIIQFGKELFNIGVQASGIERAFSRLGDSKSLAKLREETKGFVSDLELEKLTVKANNFNIPMEKLGGFLAFASIRAKETGEGVEKLTNNIIDGLGRKSSRIIDNLGISIVDIQKEFKRTGDFTTAVSNLIAKEMNSAGVSVDTLADKVNRQATTWTNLKTTIGKAFAGFFSPATADNDKIATQTTNLMKGFRNFEQLNAQQRVKALAEQTERVLALSKEFEKYNKQYSVFKLFSENQKSFSAEEKKQAGERLVAAQNVLRNLKDQNAELKTQERLAKGLVSLDELREKVTKLRGDASGIVVAKGDTKSADARNRKALLDQADQIQKEIDEITGKAQKKRDKEEDSAEKKRLARLKELNAQRLSLENDYYSAQIAAIDDVTTRAVASETVASQNKVRELKAQLVLFPELTKEINRNIENEEAESKARVLVIIQKGVEDELKIRKASSAEIAKVVNNNNQIEIDAISDKYKFIIENARKAGILTTTVEKELELARVKEVDDVIIKSQDDKLKKQEALELSAIYIRTKKSSETEKAFERKNQEDLLKINIEYAKKRLALIASDPEKVEEANKLRKAIQDAQSTIQKIKDTSSGDLFEALGIDEVKFKKATDQISKVGELASDLFGSLADASKEKVDAIQSEIDALDELMDKQQEAVDKEKDLMDKGYANNYANAQKTLEAQKVQREQLLKEQEAAQKQQEAFQKAQIIADGIGQVSNLITASTEIFKTFSKIPVFGIPLAIAAIGTMFGAFAIAKVTAFNAVGANNKFADGGTAGGKLHSEGGNKYISLDGNDRGIMEIERGEEIINRKSSEKHRKILKAINKNDFSDINMQDISIKELLSGTGVIAQLEESNSSVRHNLHINDISRTVVVNNNLKSEGYLKSMDDRLKQIEKNQSSKAHLLDFDDYYLIVDGNYTKKIWKK